MAIDRSAAPLAGRTVLVTGVSRRIGIGFAVARRAAADGANLLVHHFRPHDEAQPWGGDDVPALLAELRAAQHPGAAFADVEVDLGEADGPERLLAYAGESVGPVDALVAVHAMSGSDGPLDAISVDDLDRHWRVNARSSILLAQGFARQFSLPHAFGSEDGDPDPGVGPGRIVFFTSGQDLGPMVGEIAYATSKGALASISKAIAATLARDGITVNAINPGPVDTGYADPQARAIVADLFPAGRWGTPDDTARLVGWLLSDEARWITGQVLNSEGGFER